MQGGEFDERTATFVAFRDRALTASEAREYTEAPISAEQRDEVLALVAWFRRRYPTPLERLAYVRRACARWRQSY